METNQHTNQKTNNEQQQTSLCPYLLDMLFACKKQVSKIFHDVLGMHEINHIAINYVNHQGSLAAFSSTPSLEFNLFNSPLWRYDKTYDINWYKLCKQASWQDLYKKSRFDELYYIKQIKPGYPSGISLAAKLQNNCYVIYAFASKKKSFLSDIESFYQIGQYCTQLLLPLFLKFENQAIL